MIIRLRKIRQNLIKNSRFSKYLIYASGEIVLVTIGILLALYFDNLNSESQDKKKENWYLENILEDIRYQTEILDELEISFKESISTGKSILSDFNKNKSFTKIDSLNFKFNALMEADFFPNINNTYQEMVSSGKLSLIRNQDLSTDIIGYYLFSEENSSHFKNNIDNVFYTEVFPTFNKVTEINPDGIFEENNIKISDLIALKLEDPEIKLSLLNAIKLKILIETDHLETVLDTKEYGIEISNLILKEID